MSTFGLVTSFGDLDEIKLVGSVTLLTVFIDEVAIEAASMVVEDEFLSDNGFGFSVCIRLQGQNRDTIMTL